MIGGHPSPRPRTLTLTLSEDGSPAGIISEKKLRWFKNIPPQQNEERALNAIKEMVREMTEILSRKYG